LNLLESFILGLIQGVTEFFPVSSTAHLVLLPWFFNWKDPGLPFNVALHIGTLFSLIYYFWNEWKKIIIDFIDGLINMDFSKSPYGRLGLFIVIASIPGGVMGLLFEKQASGVFRNPLFIALTLSFFALILFFSDRYLSKIKSISEMNILDCLIIGIFQGLAIIPGVSRSGIAITGALIRGFRRDEAAKFSFLIAAPIIAGAAIFESRKLDFSVVMSVPFVVGLLSSAVFGFLAIKYLLRFVQNNSYNVFVIYRILLAILIALISFLKNGT